MDNLEHQDPSRDAGRGTISALEFGPRQRQAIAAALTLCAVAVIAAILYALFRLLAAFVSAFSPVLMPLAVAGILATMLRPVYQWILRGVRRPWFALLLLFLVVAAPIGAGLWAFGAMVAGQLRTLAEHVPLWIEAGSAKIREWMPWLSQVWSEQKDLVRGELRERGGWLAIQGWAALRGAMSAGWGAFQYVAGLFSWLVMPVYLVFLLKAPVISVDSLRDLLPFLKDETRDDVVYLVREFVNILVAFFRGQIVVALAQGVLFAIGFTLVGLQYGLTIGLIFGMLNIVPYLGNLIGLGVTIPLALFQAGGGWSMVLAVLVVFVVVQVIESYILTPKIMGDRTGLHPMAIIFSLFFWGTAFNGILGMMLGIPLTAFLVVFWRLLKAKYIRAVV